MTTLAIRVLSLIDVIDANDPKKPGVYTPVTPGDYNLVQIDNPFDPNAAKLLVIQNTLTGCSEECWRTTFKDQVTFII